MEIQRATLPGGTLYVENVGGIRETTVDFAPGVTVLVGRNATNRTSFLQGLMAALGSDDATVKGSESAAAVELALGDETYHRRLRRQGGEIVAEGEPYLEDATLADLFAFLLESNEARQTVATNGDLREVIMEPLDTDAIREEIDRLAADRDRLKRELEEIDDLKGELPELEQRRSRLQEEIDAKRAELEVTEEELEAADADLQETQAEQSKLEDELEELRAKRSRLDDIRYDLETERESLSALKQERGELREELRNLPDAQEGEIADVESRIDELRRQKQRLKTEVNELQSVIGFNEEMLRDTDADVFETVMGDSATAVTEQLLDDGSVTCWTCGSDVETDQIERTVSRLRTLSQEKVAELNELQGQIDELQARERSLQESQQECERLESRLADLEDEVVESEATVERLRSRREELTSEIEGIERDVEDLENESYDAVLDLHKEANQLEYELGKVEKDLEHVESEIAELEGRIQEEAEIEAELDTVEADIVDYQTKIDRIEEEAIEQFNEHMETILEMLEYSNLERIWIERVEEEVREGRKTVAKSAFELHVVRATESGTVYEDTVGHLSESEREITGLVFALAGFLAHEVYEEVPFMLLDSLEAIDSERIATLIDYLDDYTGYLFVALLPEDATALDEREFSNGHARVPASEL